MISLSISETHLTAEIIVFFITEKAPSSFLVFDKGVIPRGATCAALFPTGKLMLQNRYSPSKNFVLSRLHDMQCEKSGCDMRKSKRSAETSAQPVAHFILGRAKS